MDRQRALLQMAQRMSAATAGQDWTALASINTWMAASLPAMAAHGPWLPAEKAALAALRQQHLLAQARCAEQSAAVAAQLQQMNNHKEGWLAYAVNDGLAHSPELP